MAATTSGWQYAVPNDTLVAWPAVSQAVADKLETNIRNEKPGLVLLNITTFSSQSAVILNNIFSATYDNYLVHVQLTAVGGSPSLALQLRTGSSTVSSNYAGTVIFTNGSSVTGTTRGTNGFLSFAQNPGDSLQATLFRPFLATPTNYQSMSQQENLIGIDAGSNSNSVSYESLVIANVGGGTNSGTVRVYGLRNS